MLSQSSLLNNLFDIPCHSKHHTDMKTIYNVESGVCQPLLCMESLTEWLLQLLQLIFEGDLILLVPARPRYAF